MELTATGVDLPVKGGRAQRERKRPTWGARNLLAPEAGWAPFARAAAADARSRSRLPPGHRPCASGGRSVARGEWAWRALQAPPSAPAPRRTKMAAAMTMAVPPSGLRCASSAGGFGFHNCARSVRAGAGAGRTRWGDERARGAFPAGPP